MRTLVKNGRIVTAVDTYHADILIVDGTIATIGRGLSAPEADVIDAAGRMVIPGGVDPHTHLENPSGTTTTSDDFLTGSRAAAVRQGMPYYGRCRVRPPRSQLRCFAAPKGGAIRAEGA